VCAWREVDEVCGDWGVREHRLAATQKTSCLYMFALRPRAFVFKNKCWQFREAGPETVSHESGARRMGREGREGHGPEGVCAWREVDEV